MPPFVSIFAGVHNMSVANRQYNLQGRPFEFDLAP